MCVANARQLDVSCSSRFSVASVPIACHAWLAPDTARVLQKPNAQRNAFQLLLTQAAWFLQHTCTVPESSRSAILSDHVCVATHAWLWIKTRVVTGPPPLLQTFVAGLLLQTLVAVLCVEYCSLQGACRGGVCRRTPPSVTNLCREMAAQACYKANVFDWLPHVFVANARELDVVRNA